MPDAASIVRRLTAGILTYGCVRGDSVCFDRGSMIKLLLAFVLQGEVGEAAARRSIREALPFRSSYALGDLNACMVQLGSPALGVATWAHIEVHVHRALTSRRSTACPVPAQPATPAMVSGAQPRRASTKRSARGGAAQDGGRVPVPQRRKHRVLTRYRYWRNQARYWKRKAQAL